MLAGGRSRRLGGAPKGLEDIDGARILDRVAGALRAVTSDLVLVANDPDANGWLEGVAVLSDIHPGAGGLAGVEAALALGRDALVVAWDMPFVTASLLTFLVEVAGERDVDVVLPASDSPYGFEPFCAWYSVGVRSALSEFLKGGGGAARDFLRRQRLHVVSDSELREIGDVGRMFFSVNTAADLERARAMAAGSQ